MEDFGRPANRPAIAPVPFVHTLCVDGLEEGRGEDGEVQQGAGGGRRGAQYVASHTSRHDGGEGAAGARGCCLPAAAAAAAALPSAPVRGGACDERKSRG